MNLHLRPHQVTLQCEHAPTGDTRWPDGGAHALPPTPLSLLIRVFGACGAAPWFHEGVTIDVRARRELHHCFPADLDVAAQTCWLRVFGDGQGRLSADHSLTWGLTGYRDPGGAPMALHLFNEREKRALSAQFRQHRLSRSAAPYRPLVQRLDDAWHAEFLAPLALPLHGLEDCSAVFFDLWFNTSGESGESATGPAT